MLTEAIPVGIGAFAAAVPLVLLIERELGAPQLMDDVEDEIHESSSAFASRSLVPPARAVLPWLAKVTPR